MSRYRARIRPPVWRIQAQAREWRHTNRLMTRIEQGAARTRLSRKWRDLWLWQAVPDHPSRPWGVHGNA